MNSAEPARRTGAAPLPERVPRPVQAQVRALHDDGATEEEIAAQTRLRHAQVRRIIANARRYQALREQRAIEALVRDGVVTPPSVPKEPPPPRLRIEGGLSATVLADRR